MKRYDHSFSSRHFMDINSRCVMNVQTVCWCLCGVLCFFTCYSQKATDVWYFGYYTGVDFGSGSPVMLNNGQVNAYEGSAAICDPTTGSVLFYTDGVWVWDNTHSVMPNGIGLMGGDPSLSSTQAALIVPRPGSSAMYYIFTSDCGEYDSPPNEGIRYSTVDITLNGGKGDVVSATKNTLLLAPAAEKLVGVKHTNNTDYWVLAHGANNNSFYAWLVTASGVAAPVISNVGTIHDMTQGFPPYWNSALGYLKASADGSKLSAVITEQETVEIFNFDAQTGTVSSPVTLAVAYRPYGLSFSPGACRLYVTEVESGFARIYQYDLSGGTAAAILASETAIYSFSPSNGGGALQLAPDMKIYYSEFLSDYLGVINYPDSLGTACNFVSQAVLLSPGICGWGLPNYMDGMVAGTVNPVPLTADFTYSGSCTGTPVVFTDSSMGNPTGWIWNFGDTLSGPGNVSYQENTAHTYSAPGSYLVTLFINKDCSTDSVSKTIVIYPVPEVKLDNDASLCEDSALMLDAGSGSDYLWSTGAMTRELLVSAPGIYSVRVTNGYGCSASDTIVVSLAVCGEEEHALYVPAAFSPNGDGQNDLFHVLGYGINSIRIRIYNRWGEMVYESTDLTQGWDGKYKDRVQEMDVYVWYVAGKTMSGAPLFAKGDLTLVR